MTSEFNFFQHWYPLLPLEDIDPKRPTPITLLGLRLVIWKPKSSPNYQVFLDQCPHRLAPLSEGRIDENSGNLMCSYHGWEFDQKGVCTRIPQAENPEIIDKNKDNFSCISFPCRQENDLLWVWPDRNSQELAEKTSLPLSPQIDTHKGFVWSSYVRDMAYDWSTLVENVADPSHVPFAHHGVQGQRSQGQPIPIEIVESTLDLIEVKIDRGFKTTITFEPPCRLEYAINIEDKNKRFGLVVYCVPVTPGKSRIVGQFPRNFAQTLHKLTPRWWNHLTLRHLVLEGDMILLQQQECYLQEKQESETWKTAYKLPTKADRFVLEFRRWFDLYCQGELPWKNVGITETKLTINEDRHELLDRYHQHTQHCSSCRDTLHNVKIWQAILLIFAIISVIISSMMSDELRHQWGIPLGCLVMTALGVYSWLKWWLEPRFYFMDYIHADKK
jgi:phenylpropionate dioxygenase-like ring-hydroxylating dioxygenase large terminal subunit